MERHHRKRRLHARPQAEGPDLSDPTDAPLNLFPGAPDDAQSTTVFNSIKSVTASSYGSPAQFLVDDRPAAALDGNPHTGWVTAQYPLGQWWRVHFDRPQTAFVDQPGPGTASFPGRSSPKCLWPLRSSPTPPRWARHRTSSPGRRSAFPTRSFKILQIHHVAGRFSTNHSRPATRTLRASRRSDPRSDANEAVSMPQDLLRAAGTASIADPLSLVMTRLRGSGFPRGPTSSHHGQDVLAPDAADVRPDRSRPCLCPRRRRHCRPGGGRTADLVLPRWPRRRAAA